MEPLGYSQTNITMNDNSFKIPLKKGKNEVINYKTLSIAPVNLFIQDKPWNDLSASIQLELNIEEGDRNFRTFLWYFEKGMAQPLNYPLASGNYVFSLEIKDQEEVSLVITKLRFGKPFFINLGQEIIIEDLKINFKEVMDVMGAVLPGEPPSNTDSYAEYDLILSDKKEQKTLTFNSLNFYDKTEMSIEWNKYEIMVLYTEINALKLMVNKKNGAK